MFDEWEGSKVLLFAIKFLGFYYLINYIAGIWFIFKYMI